MRTRQRCTKAKKRKVPNPFTRLTFEIGDHRARIQTIFLWHRPNRYLIDARFSLLLRQALEATRFGGGKCCLIGVAKTGETIEVTPRLLIAGRTLLGTAFGGCRGKSQLPELIDRYMNGEIFVDELVTGTIALEEINEAFEKMKQDSGYRYVVKY